MTADVNVTEKVADEIVGAVFGQELPEAPIYLATAALDALADPEVLAGIAGVLSAHAARPISSPFCTCGWHPLMSYNDTEADRRQHRGHQAAAVVEWLRGRA